MTIRDIAVAFGFEIDKNSVKKTENTIKGIKDTAKKFLGGLGIGFSLVKLNALYEEWAAVNNQIKTAATSLGSVEEQEEYITKKANECRTSYTQMAAAAAKLVKNGNGMFANTEQAADFLSLATKAFRASGASVNDIGSLTNVLTSTFNTGKLTASGFSTILSTCPEIVSTLADSLGMTHQQVKALGLAGQITAKQLKNALVGSTDSINEAFENTMPTISEALIIIKNSFAEWWVQFNDTFQLTQRIAKFMITGFAVVRRVLDKITLSAKALADKLGGVEQLLKLIAITGGGLLLAIKGPAIISFLKSVLSLLTAGGIKVLAIVAVIALVGLIIEDFVNFMQGNDSVFSEFFEAMGIGAEDARKTFVELFRTLKEILSESFKIIKATLGDAWERIKAILPRIIELLMNIVVQILPVLCELLGKIAETIAYIVAELLPVLMDVIEAILSVLIDIINALLPLLKTIIDSILPVIVDLVKELAPLIKMIISRLLPPIVSILNKIIQIISKLVERIMPAVVKVLNAIIPLITKIIEKLLPIVEIVLDVLVEVLDILCELLDPLIDLIAEVLEEIAPIIEMLTTIIEVILDLVKTALQPLLEIIKIIVRLLADVLKPIIEVLRKILQPVIGVLKSVLGALQPLFDILSTLLGTILKPIITVIQNVADAFSKVFGPAIEGITSLLQPLFDILSTIMNLFSDLFGWVSDGLGGITDKVGGWASGIASTVEDAIGNAASTVGNWVSGAVETVGNWATNTWDSIKQGASNAWNTVKGWFGLANGGYIGANNPTPVVIGDNKKEGEIVSPISKMRNTVLDALRMFVGSAQVGTAQPAIVSQMSGDTVNRNVSQTVNINNTFNGPKDVQRAASSAMDKSASDVTSALANALNYGR